MSDDNKPSSSETAYRAVLEYQNAKSIAESRWSGPDTSSKETTSIHVWGALAGLFISAFQVDPAQPITLIAIPAAGIAIGAVLGWTIGKIFRLIFVTLPRLLFGGIRKVVKGKPPVS
jgi:hypothetical protein